MLVTDDLPVERRAAETGGETVAVSEDVEGGERLAEEFDCVGALLRYPID